MRLYSAYDDSIRRKTTQGKSGEELFFELALEDLIQAADLFHPIYDSTKGIDGWVSLEMSPLLAYDTAKTIKSVAQLHTQSKRPNVYGQPGTRPDNASDLAMIKTFIGQALLRLLDIVIVRGAPRVESQRSKRQKIEKANTIVDRTVLAVKNMFSPH